MKRYLVFIGENFYPDGGWKDFVESYSELAAAFEALTKLRYDWYQVVDSHEGTIVRAGGRS